LGAKKNGNVEQFGLDMFAGLLGRLNGKSETQLQKEENARRDIKLATLSSQRYGATRFVSGGFLVGEKIERIITDTLVRTPDVSSSVRINSEVSDTASSSENKKRKREDRIATAEESTTDSKSTRKMQKAMRELEDEETRAERETKGKRKKDRKGKTDITEPEAPMQLDELALPDSSSATDERIEKKQRKAEKKARREAKRLRKEKRRKKRAEAADSSSTSSDDEATEETDELYKPMTVQPAANGRFLLRQRYIQQKKLACMDQKSLNEIFMIKTPS
jgi:Pin2-interacting protein X1